MSTLLINEMYIQDCVSKPLAVSLYRHREVRLPSGAKYLAYTRHYTSLTKTLATFSASPSSTQQIRSCVHPIKVCSPS